MSNLGDYKNRIKAAEYARGKYIKYLDSDDILYPHSLQIMVDAMEKYSEAGLALSFNVIDDKEPYPQLIDSREAYTSYFLGNNPLAVGPSAAIIRRKCYETVGGFSGRLYVGDTELWLKLAANYSVVKLQPALVWWRQHEGQQIRPQLKNREIINVMYRIEMKALDDSCHLFTNSEKNTIVRFHTYRHARKILNIMIKRRKPKEAFSLFKNSGLNMRDILKSIRKINI
jgi:glycosyltransferase involved in cell wall biosynthesis